MGRKNIYSGLTIFELLIVISIVVILAAITIMIFRTQIFKGYDAKRKGDIHDIQVAIEEYDKDHNCYPLPQDVTCNPGLGLQPYLSKIPCDPETHASYYYDYQDSSCPSWYRIFTKLTNTKDQGIAEVGCQNGCGPGSAFNYVRGSPNAPLAAGQTPGGASQGGTTPAPSGYVESFWGCQGGACFPVSWDPGRPGPACDPTFKNSFCNNACGQPGTECIPWK